MLLETLLVKFYICKPKSTGRGSLIKKQTVCIPIVCKYFIFVVSMEMREKNQSHVAVQLTKRSVSRELRTTRITIQYILKNLLLRSGLAHFHHVVLQFNLFVSLGKDFRKKNSGQL
jgi:hypothetical protein